MILLSRFCKHLKKYDRRLLRSTALVFLVRGMGALSGFVMSLFIARVLSPMETGYFFLAITVISVLCPIGLLGTDTACLRFIGGYAAEDDWARSREVALVTWRWAGTVLFLGSSTLLVTAPWLAENLFKKPGFGCVLQAMSPALALMGGGMLLAAQLQAVRRTTQSVFILSICVPVCVISGIWIFPVETALAATKIYVLSGIIALSIGVYWWCRVAALSPRQGIDKIHLWNTCKPLWAITILSAIATWSSQFFAGMWVSAEEVGHLAVAQRTANLVSFILITVNFIVAPRFAALYKQEKHKEFRELALRSVRLMSVCGAPVVLSLCFFPSEVMNLFGVAFRSAAPLLVILAIGQYVNVITGSVGFMLTMSGHERDLRKLTLIAGLFTVLLTLTLTFFYGVIGAAISNALSVAVQNLGAVWLVRKRLGFNTLAVWKRVW